jgi:hypothetical protein
LGSVSAFAGRTKIAAVSIAVAAIAANLPPCGAVSHARIIVFSSLISRPAALDCIVGGLQQQRDDAQRRLERPRGWQCAKDMRPAEKRADRAGAREGKADTKSSNRTGSRPRHQRDVLFEHGAIKAVGRKKSIRIEQKHLKSTH